MNSNGKGKGKRTILVIEDYDDVRRMLKLLLESERLRVLEAATGPQALEVIKNEGPDVVMTDLALPGCDGFEIIRRIRKTDGFQDTPIIVLTAHGEQSTYEAALRAGTNYFMCKPVDFDELETLVEEILTEEMTGISDRSTVARQLNGQSSMVRCRARSERREAHRRI